ncbi:MAG TPA: peptidoglycan recognition family protein, partial [Planctomycetota bacterium]|nr:peptidoglycan recognition family protein [Planctomycetota bacterium]
MMNTRSGNQASGLILGPVAPRRVRRAAPPAPAAVPGPFEEALVSWGLRLLFVLLAAGVAGCKAYSEVPSADVQPPVCPPTPAGAEACWEPPAPLGPWRYIIVHHSATPGGSAALFEKYHRNVRHFENGMGYHFVIGNGVDVTDGLVEVGDRWVRQIQGAHVGGELNRECIGICLVGDFSQGRPTARQVASLDRLLKFLLARCRIPPSRVIG